MRRSMVPFLVYFGLANFYYTQCLLTDIRGISIWVDIETFYSNLEKSEIPDWTNATIADDIYLEYFIYIPLCLMLFQQLLRGAFQLSGEKSISHYLASGSNKVDILSHLFNLVTLVLRRVENVDMHMVRLLASLALVFLYI